MPSANTTADFVKDRGLRALATWEQYSKTDTQITYRVYGSAQIIVGYEYGARVEVSIDQPEGTRKAHQTASGYSLSSPGGNWVSVADTAWALATFDRTGSDLTAYIRARAYGETTNGYGAAFASYGGVADTGWQTVGTVSIPKLDTPAAHSNVVNTRNSDTQNTLSWTNGANPTDAKTTFIERTVDGSSTYSQITTVKGTVTSYVDKTTSANHSYTYRVRSGWGGIYSGYTTSNTTYNTPVAPGTPTCARNPDNTITATFTNTGITQSHTEMQRSTDGTNWTTLNNPPSGVGITSISDNPGGGTFYYRVRNTRGALVSAWSGASAAVVTMIPPAAPTLIAPASGAIVQTSDANIVFSWTHNPQDGSAQTAARLEYTVSGGSPITINITGATQTHTLANSFAVNAVITWKVQTKGADATYGPYSSTRSLNVYQTPMAAITSPGSVPITTLPLNVMWSYTDPSGTQQQATVQIRSSGGVVLFSRTITGSATSTLITSGDCLPANNEQYSILLSVRSTTSLMSTTESGFSTNYLEPAMPVAKLEVDDERASVSLSVFEGQDASLPATAACGILRQRKDGTLLALADNIASGTAVTDIYPPLDEELTYLFVAYAASGVASIVKETVAIPSKMTAFINFGNDMRKLAKVALDNSWNKSLNHSKEIFESAGITSNDTYPLVFYGMSKQLSGSLAGTALRSADLIGSHMQHNLISDFDALSDWTGSVVLRLPFELPFPATITVSQAIGNQHLSGISIAWERVRNYGLAL